MDWNFLGGLNSFDGQKFTHFKRTSEPSSLSDNRIFALLEDSSNRLWVGTLNGGLDLFDRSTGKFKHFNPSVKNTLNAYGISYLYEDKNKNIWIGTTAGVNILDGKTFKVKQLVNDPKNTNSLVQNDINCIVEDGRGGFG
ncbi:ligand-binding sensor domain-containing protein [Pedobacter panaciterrae]